MGDGLARSLPRVGFGAIAVAAAVIPLAFWPGFADPFMVTKATLLWLAALVAGLGLLACAVGGSGPPFPRFQALWPIGLLVGWTALATALSPTPAASFLGSYGRYDGLATLAAAVTIALALVAATWRAPERLELVAAAIAISGIVGFAYVLVEQLGWDPIDWHLQGTDRWLVGLGGNPNFSGAHLAMVVPILLAARVRVPTMAHRRALLAAAALLSVGVWWTGTRGGLVALVGGVAALGLLVPGSLPKLVRWGSVAATVLLLSGVALSGAFETLPGRQPLGSLEVFASGGINQRTNIWAGAVSMIEEHPLVGVGPDGFGRSIWEHRPSRGGRQLVAADEAHDVFLDRAATAGLPALLAELWLIAVVAIGAWRARLRLDESHRWLLGAFGGLSAAYLLQGAFSIDTAPLVLLAWIGTGALVVLGDLALAEAPGSVSDSSRSHRAGGGVIDRRGRAALMTGVAAALVLATVALRPAIADRLHRRAQEASQEKRPLDALALDARAASWLDHEPTYRIAQAADLVAYAARPDADPELRRTLLDEAIVAYGQALDRSPEDTSILVSIAETHVLAAAGTDDAAAATRHLDEGEEIYRRLLERRRATDDLHLPYGRLLEARAGLLAGGSGSDAGSTSRRDALAGAAAQFELAVRYQPDRLDALVGLARVRVEQGRSEQARSLLVEAVRVGGATPELRAAIAEVDRQIAARGS